MASRSNPAATSPPPAADESPSEHIYIGSDDLNTEPTTAARTVRAKIALDNAMRHRNVEVVLYEEGFARIATKRRGTPAESFLLDLRFVDPLPRIERVVAARAFYAALGCGVAAALAGFLLRFDALFVVAAPLLGAAVVAAAAALYIGIYRSYELTEFRTLHGRAVVLRLLANLGSMRKFRAFVPVFSHAIEEAAERIGADTATYLRAEMREHYRLRGDGVLDTEDCAASTGRILAQFDVQI